MCYTYIEGIIGYLSGRTTAGIRLPLMFKEKMAIFDACEFLETYILGI